VRIIFQLADQTLDTNCDKEQGTRATLISTTRFHLPRDEVYPIPQGSRSKFASCMLSKAHARCQLLIPVILATWKVKFKRIAVQDQSGQKNVHKSLSQPTAGHGGVWLSS
jgi:hypothetical protein